MSISDYESLSKVSGSSDDYNKDPVIMECRLSLKSCLLLQWVIRGVGLSCV